MLEEKQQNNRREIFMIGKFSLNRALVTLIDLEPTTNKRLSEELGFSFQNTHAVLKELKRFGLVKIEENEHDARENVVRLTRIGKTHALLAKASFQLSEISSKILPERILPNEQDEREFFLLLERTLKNLFLKGEEINEKRRKRS